MNNTAGILAEDFLGVFKGLPDFAIFTTNTAGAITSWNEGAKNTFGYDEGEIIGQPLSRIFPPGDGQQADWEIAEAQIHGRADAERWHERKNKSRFWGSGTLTAVRGKDHKVKGFVKILPDLSARKNAEDQNTKLLEDLRDGFSFIQKLRTERLVEPAVPVIALTALVSDEIRKRALSDGFRLFMAKPVPSEDLVLAIDEILKPRSDTQFGRAA